MYTGHDPNDYEIGKRHSLQTINLMEKDGTMAETAGAYAGQDRFDCRNNMWADMETAVRTHTRTHAHSYTSVHIASACMEPGCASLAKVSVGWVDSCWRILVELLFC